jgi:glycosyltransferase involved in cell wall biosynthesis
MKPELQTGAYDSPFESDNVYGHALDLLLRRKSAPVAGEIHLDIGCGYGCIADKIQSELARVYVGVDGSSDGLMSLAARNFESREIWLEGRHETVRRLEEVIAGRPVGSISFLDTIEHVVDGDEILLAIGDVARAHLAPVVISAPNVSHFDIGAKLAFGRWNYTVAGLLDHTHLRLFDRSLLLTALDKAGLAVVDQYDVVQPRSDQHFPSTHPALAAGTPLNGLLAEVAQQSNPSLNVNQFVCLCVPSREMDRQTYTAIREESRPLMSAVIRTQGRRLHTLVETLTCLAGQTDPDFEVVVVGHKLSFQDLQSVERIIDDSPEWLRQKIRLLRVDDGGRSRPLNVGFAAASGRYIAIVDDDDIPMGNWVAEFRKLDAKAPGRVLRCVAARQDVTNVEIGGKRGLRAEGPPAKIYPTAYNFLEHLVENKSPPITLAFPRGAFHDLRLQFDESLDTTEDWDFLLRASAYCGVAASPAIAGVYRWWTNQDSSRTEHSTEAWQANHAAILRKQDQSHFIVPKGGLAEIRRLVSNYRIESFAAPSATFFGDGSFDQKLCSTNDATIWGQRLLGNLPKDLARAVRRGLKWKCAILKLRYYVTILNKRKRRNIRSQLRIYRRFLSEFR